MDFRNIFSRRRPAIAVVETHYGEGDENAPTSKLKPKLCSNQKTHTIRKNSDVLFIYCLKT